ncbi:MAG: hypothetical protein HC845_06445 [Akkermansiaceae bacterium]|nr:hypothetical protein [Akkermansiaceae bacterium]
MNSQNPYSPPQHNDEFLLPSNIPFGNLEDKAFNKLYYRSCNVSGLAALISLGLLIIGGGLLLSNNILSSSKYIFIALLVINSITLIGLVKRTRWGRVMGVLVCILSLMNIPLGTLIGIVGLFALLGAPNLFGPDRVLHKDLKAEFKRRKQLKKLK